jgi:hypothetical protein
MLNNPIVVVLLVVVSLIFLVGVSLTIFRLVQLKKLMATKKKLKMPTEKENNNLVINRESIKNIPMLSKKQFYKNLRRVRSSQSTQEELEDVQLAVNMKQFLLYIQSLSNNEFKCVRVDVDVFQKYLDEAEESGFIQETSYSFPKICDKFGYTLIPEETYYTVVLLPKGHDYIVIGGK